MKELTRNQILKRDIENELNSNKELLKGLEKYMQDFDISPSVNSRIEFNININNLYIKVISKIEILEIELEDIKEIC